jgi:hypothetical protein
MRICEILFYDDQPAEEDHTGSQFDLVRPQYSDDLTNLANAFTKDGLVKHFWNLNGLEGQPSGPAPPTREPELIPDDPRYSRLRHPGRLDL